MLQLVRSGLVGGGGTRTAYVRTLSYVSTFGCGFATSPCRFSARPPASHNPKTMASQLRTAAFYGTGALGVGTGGKTELPTVFISRHGVLSDMRTHALTLLSLPPSSKTVTL